MAAVTSCENTPFYLRDSNLRALTCVAKNASVEISFKYTVILIFFSLQITFAVVIIHIKPLLKILLKGCLSFKVF